MLAGNTPVFRSSGIDYEDSCHAWATCCTDVNEIWRGVDQRQQCTLAQQNLTQMGKRGGQRNHMQLQNRSKLPGYIYAYST